MHALCCLTDFLHTHALLPMLQRSWTVRQEAANLLQQTAEEHLFEHFAIVVRWGGGGRDRST